jgi:8-oxo-dGTP diphosphatase
VPQDVVRAAGGVVLRPRSDGSVEVALVHRPKYDDWTIPKGKLDDGETDEECALREVAEETGLTCRLGAELPPVGYTDAQGRPKVVRYWLMSDPAGSIRADHEIDEARWVEVAAADDLLTYRRDRELLQTALAVAAAG